MITSGHLMLYSQDPDLMCDDVRATVAELAGKGADVDATVSGRGWGPVSTIARPGGGPVGLYQPCHPTACDF